MCMDLRHLVHLPNRTLNKRRNHFETTVWHNWLMPYRSLDSEKILATAKTLEQRITERFPDTGLQKVAGELVLLAGDTAREAVRLEQPVWWLRIVIITVIVVGSAMFGFVGTLLPFQQVDAISLEFVQHVEALINTLVLGALGLFMLLRLEERFKRQAVFKGLHALRSLIHIIDMHQLTKDPAALAAGMNPTPSSPRRSLAPGQLIRYLDYCSEMLSLTGKLSALYAQSVNDSVVVEAVNDIETLASNLSRKIWQKIMPLRPEKMSMKGGPKQKRNSRVTKNHAQNSPVA